MVGKGKVMSYEDIAEAQKKRDEKEAARASRPGRGRKRKSSDSASVPQPRKKSRVTEVEEAHEEIKALSMEKFCSVF